ncbi:ATP-binding cassette sub- B member 7 [Glugoides intestinalis]
MRGNIDFYEKIFRDQLETRSSKFGNQIGSTITFGEIIIFMLLKFWWWSIDFVVKMTFEVLITPIGGILAKHILSSMLKTENPTVFDIVPSYCEYIITESSKSLAKIIRLLVVNFVDCVIQLFSDFIFIFLKDDSKYKRNSLSFILFMFFFSIVKLQHLNKIFYLNNLASDANSEKEKVYVETLDLLPIVKTSCEEQAMKKKYQKKLYRWGSLIMECKTLLFSNDFVFNIFCELIVTQITVLFISTTEKNDISFSGDLKLSYGKVYNFYRILRYIPSCFISAMRLYRDLTECVTLSLRLKAYLKYAKKEVETGIRVSSFSESIKVQNLTYTNKDKLIFSNVSFTINKGDKAALFGQNGTGKSSIFKILLGFDKYRGNIFFDGIEMSRICIEDFRRLITYVPQDTKLFDETIFYNLSYGNNKPFKEIVEECQKIGIHETIMSFPSGYNTSVGEGGHKINGGLRQKIFYTRAFLCDSEIYLFDEPTNNLDQNHGKFLLEYINDPKYTNKTFFVICHDKGIVSRFPKIYHFEEGQISEVDSL